MNAHAHIEDPFQDARFATEAELLGALLSARTTAGVNAAAAIVEPGHFSDPFNARLFALLLEGAVQGLAGFHLTAWVMAQLRDDATLAELETSPSAIVARYSARACPEIGIEGYARQIRHDFLNKALKLAVEEGETGEAESLAAEMERLSRAHLSKDDSLVSVATAANTVLDRLSEAFQKGAAPRDFAYPGSVVLANVLGGWRRGRFYVIAGRPGMGKTTVALSWLLRTAHKGHGVMMFSLEMSAQELTEMALCDIAWSSSRRIEYRDISTASVTKEGFQDRFNAIYDAAPRLQELPFLIVDKPGLTIAEIRSMAMQQARRLEAEGKRLDVLCVDHLNLIAPSASYKGNKAAETEEISMSLKRLAKELDIAVISLVQLNRAVEGREDKRPGLSDLRWSGAIEQDADVVLFAYREAYYLERKKHDDMAEEAEREGKLGLKRHDLEILFAKHRGGPCPVLDFFCDMGCAVVRDRAK